jgi:hypothetical protein
MVENDNKQSSSNQTPASSPSTPNGELQRLLLRILAENPELADVKLQARPGIAGGYFPETDTVQLGGDDPDIAAHEFGHAKNLRKTQIYGKLLKLTGNITKINKNIALPAMLTIRALVANPQARNELLNTLSSLSSMAAAPGLAEELSATLEAARMSENKARTLRLLIPAFLQHVQSSTVPTATYQMGKY